MHWPTILLLRAGFAVPTCIASPDTAAGEMAGGLRSSHVSHRGSWQGIRVAFKLTIQFVETVGIFITRQAFMTVMALKYHSY